ncbi:MAG: hypothetical protein ACK6AY_12195, partial [Akkermansiaceae bacterium]
LHYVHPYGKAWHNISTQPKHNHPPVVMKDGAPTYPRRCQFSLAQHVLFLAEDCGRCAVIIARGIDFSSDSAWNSSN